MGYQVDFACIDPIHRPWVAVDVAYDNDGSVGIQNGCDDSVCGDDVPADVVDDVADVDVDVAVDGDDADGGVVVVDNFPLRDV